MVMKNRTKKERIPPHVDFTPAAELAERGRRA